ncbi:UbiD family decarboxylase [bacterium]|nr:UbiD family decarboxylase [bacterium]
MAWRDLQEWMAHLESEGELVRVADEVDPNLEITELAQRATRAGGPALLLENIKGHEFPLLVNAFGTKGRMAGSLGVADINDHADRLLEEIR